MDYYNAKKGTGKLTRKGRREEKYRRGGNRGHFAGKADGPSQKAYKREKRKERSGPQIGLTQNAERKPI